MFTGEISQVRRDRVHFTICEPQVAAWLQHTGGFYPAGRWWPCRRRPCAGAAAEVGLCGRSVSPESRTAAACSGPARSRRDEAARRCGGLEWTWTSEAALKSERQIDHKYK